MSQVLKSGAGRCISCRSPADLVNYNKVLQQLPLFFFFFLFHFPATPGPISGTTTSSKSKVGRRMKSQPRGRIRPILGQIRIRVGWLSGFVSILGRRRDSSSSSSSSAGRQRQRQRTAATTGSSGGGGVRNGATLIGFGFPSTLKIRTPNRFWLPLLDRQRFDFWDFFFFLYSSFRRRSEISLSGEVGPTT